MEISDEPGCYEDAYRAWVGRKAPDQLDLVSPGLPPAAETWYRTMGIRDGIQHPEERFPKRAIVLRGRGDLTHSAFVAEQTIAYIRRHREDPFLCIAGFYSPHSPWIAPQEFLDLYDPGSFTLPELPPEVDARRSDVFCSDDELRSARHGYYAMVSEVDHHVGRILACLDEQGIAENTIVLFTSDHGEWLGDHLRYGKGYPGDDPISRVPLIVRWPQGISSPGRTVRGIVEAVDVLPTLLECSGIPVPYHVQGRSLLSIVEGRGTEGRNSALTEMQGAKALRTERYRYIAGTDGKETLYDLTEDPGEYRNVAGNSDYASALAELRRVLLCRLIEMERPVPRAWAY